MPVCVLTRAAEDQNQLIAAWHRAVEKTTPVAANMNLSSSYPRNTAKSKAIKKLAKDLNESLDQKTLATAFGR